MPYYHFHLFFCTNQRDAGRTCCNQAGASAVRDYAKQRIKALGLSGSGGVRVNISGCLGRCGEGPVAVVYPQGIWYSYASQDDVEEILQRHLIGGDIVERLRLPDAPAQDNP